MPVMQRLERFVSRYWFYRLAVAVFTAYVRLLYGLEIRGAERVPEAEDRQGRGERGLVVACNHISSWDPPVVGVSVPRQVNFMAKKELFAGAWARVLMAGLRAFPVDRSRNDIGAIKEAMRRLQEGRAIGIFAQGTRNAGDAEAFDGAAFIATRAKVPLQPAAIWREGRRFVVAFGEPIEPRGRSRDEVRATTAELMHRIDALLPARAPSIELDPGPAEPDPIDAGNTVGDAGGAPDRGGPADPARDEEAHRDPVR